ncbi:leucine-rich repeat protein [Treponema sp.]|uniref:leucine-rich repeat protein n=1 Tax=Treponema sp. TaxID=166 RepID=UPI00388F1C6B
MKIKKHITGFINIQLFLLCTALTVLSCTNFSSSDSGSRYSGKKIKFTGNIVMEDTSGAVPEEIQNLFASEGSDSNERSATVEPFVYDTTKHYYYAEATLRVKGTKVTEVIWDDSHTTFSMELPDYGTWDVEVGIKYSTENKIIYSSKEPVEIIQGGPTSYSKNFIAKPSQSDDKNGKINLEISTATNSGINFVQINLLNGNSTNWNTLFSGTNCILPVSSDKITIGGSGKNLPSGNYTVQIDFYDYNSFNANDLPSAVAAVSTGGAVLVYSTIQTINIYDDLITNRWVSVNSDTNNPIDTSGKFTITQNILNSYTLTNICVASNGSDSNFGTVYNPYKTLDKAISYINERGSSSNDFTISVSGDVECNTEISLATSKAKTLTIKGKSGSNANDKLNGKSNGRVLKLNTGISVTIENLTITGGSVTGENGGGIDLEKGTLKLGEGAKITGNKAALSNSAGGKGGGIYVASGAKLFMYETAMIGDGIKYTATSSTLTSSGTTGCANAAVSGGGIYNNGGEVYIGYEALDGSTLVKHDMDSRSGVCRNYAYGDNGAGGGIYNQGTLYIASGFVSYNQSPANGGGIYTAGTDQVTATFTVEAPKVTNNNRFVMYGNKADQGGAVYNEKFSTVNMSTCQIGTSTEKDRNTASTKGGAIYQNGIFNISGAAYIYPGSEKLNDVYLTKYNVINISGTLTTFDNIVVATITPNEYKRGTKIVTSDSSVSINNAIVGKFKLSQDDSDWTKNIVDSNKGITITAPVYVAGDSETTVSGVTYKKGLSIEEGALGTKSKPFKFISDAVGVFEDSSSPAVVTIVGTTYPVAQEIPDTFTTSKATALTLKGLSSSSVGTIKRYTTVPSSTASDGSALTVNSAVPVTIQDITITGGYANKGGGLYIGAGSVSLGDGVVITGNSTPTNNVTYGGAGAYVASGAKLFMYGTARIGGSGTALASTSTGNYGYSGGGILSDGNVYLGYKSCNASTGVPADSDAQSLSGGLTQNYAESTGGGITLHGSGKLYIKSGNISYNNAKDGGSNTKGGGIACDAGTTVTMAGGTIAGNKAYSGGGVYLLGNNSYTTTFTMSAGTIGKAGTSSDPVNAAAESTAGKHSNYASSGAGIYAYTNTNVTITGGNIKYNYASSYGGALYWKGATLSVNKSGSTYGTLSYNRALKGGAVYFDADGNLTQAMMNNNQADNMGGAIYISGSKNVEINGAMKINGNETIGSNSYTASGGGIYNAGNLTISGSVQMQSNTANGNSNNGWGGAIFNTSSLIITGAMTMDSNSAVSTGSGKTAYGGAIYNSGSITMSAGSIGSSTSNYVSAASAANAQGGAIYVYGTATISGTAYVKYGNSTKPNDIYLSSTGKTIGLDSSLSNHSASDQVGVTLGGTWNTGTAVLSGSANNIKSHYMKIKLTNNSTRFVDSDGTLRQGAAATPANAAAAVANLTSGGTLKLTGNPTAQQILDIRDALYNTYKNYSNANMPSIVIDLSDTTITSIPENAFWPAIDSGSQCKAISAVKLPTTVTSIGKNAFAYCSNMTSITGYTQVTSLGDGAFEFCSSLTSFTIPSGLTSKKVPDSLLYGCGNITSINIPSGFTEIGDSAFFNAGLTSVTIPPSVTTIDRLAFNYCKFTTFSVPSSVTTLGEYFMSNNKSLTSVTIPNNSISKIPDHAFSGCSALTTVNYYNNITEIGKQAFEECTSLTSFTVKTNVRKVGYCFLWKDGNISTITFQVTTGWKYKNGNTETSVDSIIANQTDLKNTLIGVLGEYGYSLGNSQDWYR